MSHPRFCPLSLAFAGVMMVARTQSHSPPPLQRMHISEQQPLRLQLLKRQHPQQQQTQQQQQQKQDCQGTSAQLQVHGSRSWCICNKGTLCVGTSMPTADHPFGEGCHRGHNSHSGRPITGFSSDCLGCECQGTEGTCTRSFVATSIIAAPAVSQALGWFLLCAAAYRGSARAGAAGPAGQLHITLLSFPCICDVSSSCPSLPMVLFSPPGRCACSLFYHCTSTHPSPLC